MSSSAASGSHAPHGLLGALGSWLRSWSDEVWHSSDDNPREVDWPKALSNRAMHVLVVDDNPLNLMLISALMDAREIVATLASDGVQALALAREHAFDLILMDLQMPILDGSGATAVIRRFETNASRSTSPVVAYSSAAPGAEFLAKWGMNGSLNKPCEDQDLEDCLVKWCPAYCSASALRRVDRCGDSWPATGRKPGLRNWALRAWSCRAMDG